MVGTEILNLSALKPLVWKRYTDDIFSMMKIYLMSNIKNAQNVWNTFRLKTISEDYDLHLKSDVLLLADVFENLINNCCLCLSLA